MKKKKQHFLENKTFSHLFQPTFEEVREGYALKGKWHTYFKNNHPIVLELGCGKGEYTVGLAQKYPHKNFIGLDQKGARLWRGGKTVQELQIPNAAFIRSSGEFLEYLFDREELSAIWITFPEPHPQQAKAKKRFTSPQFNQRFKNILKKEGIIHLKTDNPEFYNFTLESIEASGHLLLAKYDNLYAENPHEEVQEIQTYYEKIWLREGRTIKYLRYQLNPHFFEGRYQITTDLNTQNYHKKPQHRD
ncbi:MAG: tRNA (guanosine(46)-N7)-methyltransferase TrmB [Bacteroidetes bacterium]|nr:MAG: tRNA (guanosine(46)-N7)-methyltransferase TrmB [Bacteroidota bacterium]PIE88500.1 MAG: tRNA (guanosine(46)-N7)-methyltransferase TrmB [Bacteroidota bacterium]